MLSTTRPARRAMALCRGPGLAACLAALSCQLIALPALAQAAGSTEVDPLRETVLTTERAFARSMAERDLGAFGRFLSADAVFDGTDKPLRGKAAVLAAWQRYFEGPQAPFSWEPDQVLVMSDGQLALSSGPVRDPSGRLIARFQSVWRQEAPGVWRIVLDSGTSACECKGR